MPAQFQSCLSIWNEIYIKRIAGGAATNWFWKSGVSRIKIKIKIFMNYRAQVEKYLENR